MHYTSNNWQPTKIIRAGAYEETSTGVTQVETDAGWAYCKPVGNRSGPQVLACEWVCVRLAKWFGLATFDAAVIPLDDAVTFPLPEHKGNKYHAQAGPAFLTRSTPGRRWNTSTDDLKSLVNPLDITLLVAFDTWILNRDRYYPIPGVRDPNYGNVYFAEDASGADRFRLFAMDHTHCFNNGVLDKRLAQIDFVKDEKVYGMFPEFVDFIDLGAKTAAAEPLREVDGGMIQPILNEVPAEWEVDITVRAAWKDLIVGRAGFLGEKLPMML